VVRRKEIPDQLRLGNRERRRLPAIYDVLDGVIIAAVDDVVGRNEPEISSVA
jgi:hypothetical protein